MKLILTLFALWTAVGPAAGHVAMLNPPSGAMRAAKWAMMSESWQWRLGNGPRAQLLVGSGSTSALAWFNNYTWVNKTTLDPSLRTMSMMAKGKMRPKRILKHMRNVLGFKNFMPELISGGYLNNPLPTEGTVDLTKLMSWRAPGFAPLQSPCHWCRRWQRAQLHSAAGGAVHRIRKAGGAGGRSWRVGACSKQQVGAMGGALTH